MHNVDQWQRWLVRQWESQNSRVQLEIIGKKYLCDDL